MSRFTALAATTLACWIVALSTCSEHLQAGERSFYGASESSDVILGETTAFDTAMDAHVSQDAYAALSVADGPPAVQSTLRQPDSGLLCESPAVDESPVVEEPDWPPVEYCEHCDHGRPCNCEPGVLTRDRWFLGLGVAALQSDMATGEYEIWPSDFGPQGRLTFGHEWESGLGVRGQLSGYNVEGQIIDSTALHTYYSFFYYIPGSVNTPHLYFNSFATYTKIEINAVAAYLDVYKLMRSRHGELRVGMGPAIGHLEFNYPPTGHGTMYNGAGASVFGLGYVPLVHHKRWEFALVGQTRFALLAGKWQVELYGYSAENRENLSIIELGIGPELRFRMDPTGERYCFLSTLYELQQWRSERMGPTDGDTLDLRGVSVNFGAMW